MVKNPPAKGGDMGSIPRMGGSPGEENGNLLQYSCLENPMDRGAPRATVHRVAKNQTWVSTHMHLAKNKDTCINFHILNWSERLDFLGEYKEKEIAAYKWIIMILSIDKKKKQPQYKCFRCHHYMPIPTFRSIKIKGKIIRKSKAISLIPTAKVNRWETERTSWNGHLWFNWHF